MPAAIIKEITNKHLSGVVDVHMLAFPESAITSLGRKAVKRYYAWQFQSARQLYALGAYRDDGKLVGFCFGGVFNAALGGYLRANRGFLIRTILLRPWVLMNSRVRDRFVFSVWYTLQSRLRQRKKVEQVTFRAQSIKPEVPFSILSIATHPEAQGRGVGRCLMDRAERAAIDDGFQEMSLTVHPSNTQATGFYERLGWAKVPDATGEWTGKMQKPLKKLLPEDLHQG